MGSRALAIVIGLIALFHLPADPATAQLSLEQLEAVDRFVAQQRARFGWPGVVVSIATPDSVLHVAADGVGTKGLDPLGPHTPFYIGSVTKALTATGIMILVDQGQLELDAPVERYLPEFSLRSPFQPGSISVRHLLHHRSGLSTWDGHDGVAQESGRFNHLAPVGTPGEAARYSSLNFIILGRIIEAVTGQSYSTWLQEVLLDPLGMVDGGVEGAEVRPAPGIQSHQNVFGFDLPMEEPVPPLYLVPAGYVTASAVDLGRFTGMLLGGGVFEGHRVLSPEAVETLLAPMDGTGPAMAWGRGTINGTPVLGHNGNAHGSSARVLVATARGYAVNVLVNTSAGPFFDAPEALSEGVLAILEGEEAPSLFPKERVFKGILLVGTLLSLGVMVRHAWRWNVGGRPVTFAVDRATLGLLLLDVAGALVLTVGVPQYVGVPLHTMIDYFPDLGMSLAATAVAGIVGGVFRSFVRSSPAAVE